jgi:CRISPR-associated endonuclease Csn1
MLKVIMSQNRKQPMRYRLALDLGSTSLGWAMIRLNAENQPCAVIKAGVRIFSDGRNPKDGSSLAVTRREARAMRRRRDRLLKRKARMMLTLTTHGFFPKDEAARKELETLNPYALRAKGLEGALKPEEFARALFHINQRRGFKSNRKTDKKDSDSGALKTAINKLRLMLRETGCRTVGEWLNKRDLAGETVRARYRQNKVVKDDGKTRIDKSYDLYIDRAMIEAEFDALWAKQQELNPALFNETARYELKDCLLHQRPLKPVKPGRCTLLPEEERAPLALPSTQRFRIYQEVNNLRILREGLKEEPLTLQQRNELANALDQNSKCTFTQIKKLLGLGGAVQFNFEDPKRQEFKGNVTNAILRKGEHFGEAWMGFDEAKQDAIVLQLVKEENEAKLVAWLQQETGIDEKRAEAIANVGLPEGYGSLSAEALARILPELRRDVITYDKAVLAAGFDHHSNISPAATGEILPQLPYYGEQLQRHVGFGTGNPQDTPEKRFGKIANPTVHIGLNQVRLVVNALIKRYGHPSEVIVEIARDLKRSKELRDEDAKRQAENQRRNQRHRAAIAEALDTSVERVRNADLQKMVLWEELSFDPAFRRCPYSGVQISAAMLLSDEVEIEHILPFSQTLDDSLNNKTVAMRQANRIKGNHTPWEAFGKQTQAGFDYQTILQRAELMPKAKRYRFAEDGLQRWLKDDKGFLARALNDTKHLSKVAREYVSLICPQNTRVIPGQMTAMLRGKFGLNDVLSLTGEKNRNDHRHHAVDACVIGVTDQGLLQRFAQASASARERQLNRLVDNMPLPWGAYEDKKYWKSVKHAIDNIWVSHKPDHSHEGGMFDATIYGLRGTGKVTYRQEIDGNRHRPVLNREVVEFSDAKPQSLKGARHGMLEDGKPKSYMGLWSRSNYAIEIYRTEQDSWDSDVIERYRAYQIAAENGPDRLRHATLSLCNRPLVMRLLIDDLVYAEIEGKRTLLKVLKINSTGAITFILHNETNVGARYIDKLAAQKNQKAGKPFDLSALQDDFFQKSISTASLRNFKARRVSVSPIGELRDPGFKE